MTKTTAERIKQAEERAARAFLQLKALKVEAVGEQRRLDARRKAIIGGWLMANKPELVSQIVMAFKRDQDTAVFQGWSAATTRVDIDVTEPPITAPSSGGS